MLTIGQKESLESVTYSGDVTWANCSIGPGTITIQGNLYGRGLIVAKDSITLIVECNLYSLENLSSLPKIPSNVLAVLQRRGGDVTVANMIVDSRTK